MHIAIKRLSAPRKDDQLIILFEKDSEIPFADFSVTERRYIKEELKNERKLILVNQYNRMVYLQQVDKASTSDLRSENLRKAGAALGTRLQTAHCDEVVIWSKKSSADCLLVAEGMVLGAYQFLKYRTNAKKEQNKLKSILLCAPDLADKDLNTLKVLLESMYRTRDLVNEPQSHQTATVLANEFRKMAKEAGFSIQVLDKKKISALKMGGLLAVNQGSTQPPTFSIMEWKPKGAVNKQPIVLVGKGVVYDTGGLSLKQTANSMDYMKCDMAGSAVVAGALYAVAKAKLPLHVIGLVPSTDNRLSGDAYAPGDVITMMSGKTVEVMNTDAEGRLILADALHYAKRLKPEVVFNFATLTGAAAAAIGPYGIVCMGNIEDKLRNELKAAGNRVYERLAEMPFWEEYDELLKSDTADMKNIGGPTAGAITAGRFLAKFTDYPFMHFDIAGPAYGKGNDSYRGKNGNGYGVRFLFDYFRKRVS